MGVRGTAAYGIDWRHLLSTAFFVHGWYPTTISSVVPGGWSIAVEMTFYMCLPWLAGHIRSLKKSLQYFITFVVVATLLQWGMLWLLKQISAIPEIILNLFLYYWFPYQLPVFLLGFVLYYLIQSSPSATVAKLDRWNRLSQKTKGYYLISVAVSIFTIAAIIRPPQVHLVNSVSYVLLAYGLHLFPSHLFVNRTICYIGRISFSAYLTHFFVLDITNTFLRDMFENMNLTSPLILYGALSLFGLLGTVALSTITYNVIEKPGMKFAVSIAGKLNKM